MRKLFKQIYIASLRSNRNKIILFFEILLLKIINKIEWRHYIIGELYSSNLKLKNRLEYLGYTKLDKFLRQVNPVKNRILADDKYVQKLIFKSFDIPVPKMYGFLHQELGIDLNKNALQNTYDLKKLLEREKVDCCVLKPIRSRHGNEFKIFYIKNKNKFTETESKYFVTEKNISENQKINNNSEGYICEELVGQHGALASINPNSLNTLRVWVWKGQEKSVIIGAFLRASKSQTPVDNTSAGGVVARIDINSGVVVSNFFEVDDSFQYHEVSPVGGIKVQGMKIPYWDDVVTIALKGGDCLNGLKLLALDIGISEAGPVCIEVNAEGSFQGQFLMKFGFGQLRNQVSAV
ncbi:MAG: sugar-transfer associated ATP-grasp domain-containing protein [Desulfurivibrionaceae bacterium]